MDLNEKFLYHIWDAGHLKDKLKTCSGKSLKIIYQGQFNTDRGPDFRNAIIEIEGQSLRGDIEIHIKTSDWNAHNHAEDRHYNALVLHVVLHHNLLTPYTIKEDGEAVEILELDVCLSDDIEKLINLHQSEPEYPINSYCELLSAVETHTLTSILNIYGKQRFLSKVKRFNAMLGLSSFDQIIWEGMMEAIGYNKNKINMLQIAQSISIGMIRGWISDGATAEDIIAIILVCTGLMERSGKMLESELAESILKRFETQRYYAGRIDIDWQLFRIRPVNHPLYRLIHLIRFVCECDNLLSDFLILDDIMVDDPGILIRNLRRLFKLRPSPLWDDLPGIGAGTLRTMVVNIFLPIQFLYYQKIADQRMTENLLETYRNQPGLVDNHITRFMQSHLNPGQAETIRDKEILQQGLIELYYRHCRFHLCRECMNSYKHLEDQ